MEGKFENEKNNGDIAKTKSKIEEAKREAEKTPKERPTLIKRQRLSMEKCHLSKRVRGFGT